MLTRRGLLLSATTALASNRTVSAAPDVEAVRRQGRSVGDRCRAADAKPVVARFDPRMAADVPEASLKTLLDQFKKDGPIGERKREEIIPSPSGAVYKALHALGSGDLEITVSFDAAMRIDGLSLKPVPRADGPGPDPRAGYRLRASLRLPMDGEWWVFWGGATVAENYHVAHREQRHAYDLVVRRNLSTHRGAGRQNSDYHAFGQKILAPAAGKVITALDGIVDNNPGNMNTAQIYGNHVVIDLGHSEFAVLCHLKQGSVAVKPGAAVRHGQLLGLCGNSGNSSEAHLHFHVQDVPKLGAGATGLPAPFAALLVNGKRVANVEPSRGQTIRHP